MDSLAHHSSGQIECRPLPEEARVDPNLAGEASPWLDSYITFSREWSPRAYDGFHEAVALWLLSTIAARRVVLHFGGKRYTPLMIALASRTSLYAKTTTAEIGIDTLRTAGLDWLLAADDTTPQRFLYDMGMHVPHEYPGLLPPEQERTRNRLAFAGQQGWFYEEFGQKLHAMMREGGLMADFRGILRRFDSCPERYENRTLSRGTDIIMRPYLALLCNITPADLQPFAKSGSALWNDGFWARFAFVTPPIDSRSTAQFPVGERTIPHDLTAPLQEWHARLGMPQVIIQHAQHAPEGLRALCEPAQESACLLEDGIREAFYRYNDALLNLMSDEANTDLDGNYARFAEKALRIAMLLASLESQDHLQMRHWARGQEIAERWRASLHRLLIQVNEPTPSEGAQREEKILQIISKHGGGTAAEISRYIRGMSAYEVYKRLLILDKAGILKTTKTQRGTLRFHLATPES